MYLDLLLKKWIVVHDQSGSAEDRYKPSKQIRFKISMIDQIYEFTAMHILLLLKKILLLQIQVKTIGILWNYYRDEPNIGAEGNINYSIKDSKSFDYKTKITGRLEGNNTKKEVEIVVPLKHLSNFWRTLDIPLINCEINLILTWSENYVITSKATRDADPGADPVIAAVNNPTNTTFKINYTKLYVPIVTLSTKDDHKLREIKNRI